MSVHIEAVIDPQVASRIKDIGRLSTLPQVTWELMRLLNDEHTTPDDLQQVIEQDPAISAKVISLGNSAYYGLRTPATTISRAIVVIGFKELEFLAMGLGLADTFDLRKVPYGFDGESLWLHSLSVSWTARELAASTRLVDPGEAMLAGLLHNLGLIMLVTHFTVHLQRLMDLMEHGYSFDEAEAELGLWHEAIGFLLAKNWNMPSYLQNVILHHHRPEVSPGDSLISAVVNLSIHLVNKTNFMLPYEAESSQPDDYLNVLPSIGVEEKNKLLDKMRNTLPLMAPTWLQMLGARRIRRHTN